jgi:hypothetical protein
MAVVAVVATVLVLRWAPESRPSEGTRMDWLGVAPLVLAVASVLFALNEAGKLGSARWAMVVGLLVLGVALLVAFYQVEKRRSEPLVNAAHLRQRETWALLLTTLLTMTGIFATINGLVVTFAQDGHLGFGLRPDVTSRLLLTPFALVGWIVGPFAGRLAPRWGYRRVLRVGLLGSIVSLALMATAGLHAVLPVVQVLGSPTGSDSSAGFAGGIGLGLLITAGALGVSFLIPRPAAAELGSAPDPADTAAAA